MNRLYQQLTNAGFKLTPPFSGPPLSRPAGSGGRDEASVLDNLKIRLAVVEAALQQDVDLADNKGMFWVACRRFNLRPSQSFLDLIESDDVLEIYTLDFKQMFCSFNFWSMVSYSLDQVFANEFWELYGRDSRINDEIGSTISRALRQRTTVAYETPPHVMQELASPAQYRFEMTLGYVAPLYDRQTGQPAAFVSTLKARRMDLEPGPSSG